MPEKIQKRNGAIVDLDPAKMTKAICGAFTEVHGSCDEAMVDKTITQSVVETLNNTHGGTVPHVEHVQDLVEKAIMAAGHHDVAKAYIIYRYEHQKIRQDEKEEVAEKIEEGALQITKRDGKSQKFDIAKVRRSFTLASGDLLDTKLVSVDTIVAQVQSEMYEGITTADIALSILMTVRSLIEQDPVYTKIAARLLLNQIYKEVVTPDTMDFSKLDAQYRAAFQLGLTEGIECGRLDPMLLDKRFDHAALAEALVLERDHQFKYLGIQTLFDRYFVTNPTTKRVLETPQAFYMRVAMGLSFNESDPTAKAKEFYEAMSTFRFVPSTPTLFHAGTHKPQLSSCYLNTVEDSLDHIFKVYGDNAQLSKWSGGIGTDWTNVRATGSLVKGPSIDSQGVVPFLKIANDVTVAINRSGRRRGATCVYLEVWHADYEDFLELRKNTGDERRRTHDMDTASWIPDLFMKRIQTDGMWSFFSPDETPELHHIFGQAFETKYAEYEAKGLAGELTIFRQMPAKDLWKKMLAMLFETGHPWVTWKDPSNVRSPQDHVGVVHNSNLCTEITLNNSADETAVCNLGWVNFAVHVTDGKFDEELVQSTVTTGMRMLDNVVDLNFYPTIETKTSNMRHRPIGLGMGGFHDALYQIGINFDSEAAVQFADESMEMISYYAILESSKLAKERGAYESYSGSKWDRGIFPIDTLDLLAAERGQTIDVPRTSTMDWTAVRAHVREHGMRNSNCMAVAPTATTSNIVGSIPTIEPIYKNIYVKSNQGGDFIVINEYLVEELKALKLWDAEMVGKLKYHDGSIQKISEIPEAVRAKYKEVFEMDPRWLIKAAAYRGKWIDQSQSLNIFFTGTNGKQLSEVYFYAWQLGLKTTYYLRTLAASQVEKSTVETQKFGSTHKRADKTTELALAPIMAANPIGMSENTVSAATPEVAKTPTMASPEGTAKLCRIDDPTCEACQ